MGYDTKQELYSAIEKGFSSYVKACLAHKSSKIFKSYDQDKNRFMPLNDLNERTLPQINEYTNQLILFEEKDSLFEALLSLNSLERRLIHLKFHEEKTDFEVAKSLGVSRQAVTKAKKKLLIKIKKN